jgi:hypothetical protein
MPTVIEFAFESRLVEADAAAVVRLARHVWRSNTARGLSGEMRLSGRSVQQVLEGDIDIVLPLVARILSDDRHGDIRVMALGMIPARRHGGWQVHGLPALAAAPMAEAEPAVIRLAPGRRAAGVELPLRRRA